MEAGGELRSAACREAAYVRPVDRKGKVLRSMHAPFSAQLFAQLTRAAQGLALHHAERRG